MKYIDIEQDIRLVAESMEPGQTHRQVCSACASKTSERSLTITLYSNGIVKYNCFRETCPFKVRGSFFLNNKAEILNRLTSSPEAAPTDGPAPKTRLFKPVLPKRTKFNGVTYPLTEYEREWIYKAWGIEIENNREAITIKNPNAGFPYWYHTPQFGGRVAMSIRSPKYSHRGWVLRDIENKAQSKALTMLDPLSTPLSWYRNRNLESRGTILVEDIPSAVRASKYINACALLGSGAGVERASEIDRVATRPIYIALDQDATKGSFAMWHKWSLTWGPGCTVMPLRFDLKDLQEKDLERLLTRMMDRKAITAVQ